MNKTFKSAVSHREVRIWPTDAGFAVAVLDDVSNEATSTQLATTDAPVIALAILEASGITATRTDTYTVGEPDNLARIAADLQHHIEVRDKAAKEAADREALEAEARILFDAGTDYLNEVSLTERKPLRWEEVSDTIREAHRIVARKAREVHGGTK